MIRPASIEPLSPRLAGLLLGFGAVYALCLVAGSAWRPASAFISPFWPASGLVFAAFVVSPPRRWPWLFVVGLSVNLAYNLVNGRSGLPAGLLAATNHFDAILGAWLLRRFRPQGVTFDRLGDAVALPIASVAASMLAGGVAAWLIAPAVGLHPTAFFQGWLTSHVVSALLIVPLVVTWGKVDTLRGSIPWTRVMEAALMTAAAAWVVWASFGPRSVRLQYFPLPYMGIVPLAWAALRFGPRGTCGVALVMVVMLIATFDLPGALLAERPPDQRAIMIQMQLGIFAAVALLLAAGLAEMRLAARISREQEERYRSWFEHSPYPVGLFQDNALVFHNPAFGSLFGLREPSVRGPRSLAEFYSPDDLPRIREKEVYNEITVSGRHVDGSKLLLAVRARRMEMDGRPTLLVAHRDLTAGLRNEVELRRLNRVLRTITACNRALFHAESEKGLLEEICQIIATSEGFRMAWVGYAQHDERRTILPVAQAGFEVGYLESKSISWGETPEGLGPSGRAIRTGHPATCRNIATDPDFVRWREDAVKRGYRSSIALPLPVKGGVVGVLNVYSSEADAFDDEEVRLLEEMATSLTYGIETLREREAHRESDMQVRSLLADAEQGRRALLSLLEDHRRTEEARARSERLYREAMHNSAIGMAIVSTEGQWIEVNPALCRILGYTREELLATNYRSITVAEDLTASVTATADVLSGLTDRFSLEKRYRHKSGRIVWTHLNVSLVRDASGHPLHFVSQTQDITARKQAEDSLSSMAERLSLALRAASMGVWQYNFQTEAIEWDTRMFDLFGLPPASTPPGRDDILACVVEEDREAVRRSWSAAPSSGSSYRLRFRVRRSKAQDRHVELHGLIRHDTLGRPEWVIGVASDITEIVVATAESERLRTQLVQAQKMETLGQLAAGVAHDFNNLLTGINGFVELASSSLPPGHEAAELLRQARRGAMSARDLVRRILNFSRTNGEQARRILNLADVIKETAPLIAATLPSNVSLAVDAACENATALADESQIQQIVLNLCTNGAHAIGEGRGGIRLAVRRVRLGAGEDVRSPAGCADGDYVEISVKDNGCGMDQATQKRIFEPFFTTKRSTQGTGLGLAIVRDILAGHGGGVAVESEVGAGSTFRIYLPLARDAAALPGGGVSQRGSSGTGQRILIVDDEYTVAFVAKVALEKSGYSAEMTTSPEEALERFASGDTPCDLLLIDHNMPAIAGPDFIRRIRPIAPNLPIILMSGRASANGSGFELDGRRVATLNKPFEIRELVAVIERQLASPATASGGQS